MNFFIYSRKSVFTGKGKSTENQIDMCREYIHTKFKNVTDNDIEIYEDEGYSGKTIDRPDFKRMQRDLKLTPPDCVVCYRLDRISRSVSDFSTLIEDLNNQSVTFICIKEEFDTSKPMGKAMMYIASVFAQLERETIAERVRDNMLLLARTGRWLGGTTPTGFVSEKVEEFILDGKIKTSCKLKFNDNEIQTIKIIYDKFLELHSISGVSKYLIKQNISSRTGKMFSLVGIKEILSNPVYCIADKQARDYFCKQNSDVCFEEKECSDKFGLLSYNKRDYKKKHAPRQSKDQWIIAKGKHKGIVSGLNWVAIQSVLEGNKPTSHEASNMHNDYSLLSGHIICKECGSRMFAKAHSNKKENGLFYYMCQSKIRGGLELCHCQNLNGQQIDDAVCEYLLKYANENSNIFRLLEKLKSDLQNTKARNPMEELVIQIKKCNKEIDSLISTLLHPNLNAVIIQKINKKVSEINNRVSQLEEEKRHLQSNSDYITDKEIQLDMIANVLSSFKANFEDLSIHEKRTLVRLLIQKIEWDGENIHIFIYGEQSVIT